MAIVTRDYTFQGPDVPEIDNLVSGSVTCVATTSTGITITYDDALTLMSDLDEAMLGLGFVPGTVSPAGVLAMRGIRNFSPVNFLERAAGSALSGNATAWEAFGLAILDLSEATGLGQREIMSCVAQFNGPGWMAGVDDTRPIYATTNGAGTRFGVFVGNWMRTMTSKQLVFLHTGFDGADAFLYVNGREFTRNNTGSFLPATGPFRIGLNGGSATSPADGMTVLGMAFKSDGVLTEAQRLDSIRDFFLNHAIADGVWTNKYDFSELAVGAVPATVSDSLGALDLTLNGALVVVDDASATLSRTQDPAPDTIVTRSSNIAVKTNQTVSAVGPTTVSNEVVFADTSVNAVGITLPAFPPTGGVVRVIDRNGNAGTNNITVNGNGGQLVDGAASHVIAEDYGATSYVYDGTNWTIEPTPSISGGGSDVLFKWNESDTTQFGSNLLTPTAGSAALSVDTSDPKQILLNIDLTGFQGLAAFHATIPALPRRYLLEYRVVEKTGGTSSDRPVLYYVSNGASGAAFRAGGYERTISVSAVNLGNYQGTSRVSNVSVNMGTNASTGLKGTLEQLRYQGEAFPFAATAPDWMLHMLSIGSNGFPGGEAVASSEIGSFTGWDVTPTGIAIGANYANAVTGTISLADLIVRKHPMDL